MNDIYIILLGAIIACSCSLLGCFLVLRKMTMMGDAISHAVLPGIIIAFLFSGYRDHFSMIIGAAVTGLLTTFLIEVLNKKVQLQEDASIGIVFTWLFSIGIILIALFADKIDLDQDCVLYGEIGYVGLVNKGIPKEIWTMSIILFLVISFIVVGFKQLQITTFDLAFANVIGINSEFWHYLLMSMVSITTVAAFESVGSILVVSFLILPASAAYLLTEKLKYMLIYSCIIGIIGSIGGYFLAVKIDGAIAPSISAVCGFQFLCILVWKILSKK